MRRTKILSVFDGNGACLRPLVCVSLYALIFSWCSGNLLLTSSVLFAALRRPKLNEDGHNRVLRALHHKQHHYKHFIRPELLALYSFGPEPSEDVLSLQEINEKSEYLDQLYYLFRSDDSIS